MSARMPSPPHFCQVALSIADTPASLRFYMDGLGLTDAGGRYLSGQRLGAIQGLEDPAAVVWWLVTGQPFFQLELFNYATPVPAQRREDWKASDVGYSSIIIGVADLDASLRRLVAHEGRAFAPPVKMADGGRRAALLDPTGIHVELVERPGLELPCIFEGLSASVQSLERARAYFSGAAGLKPVPAGELSDPARQHLRNLPGASCDQLVLAGSGGFIELVSYAEPAARPRRRGHRVNDLGILNVALGFRRWPSFGAAYGRMERAQYKRETTPIGPGGVFDVSYCTGPEAFSIELLYCPPRSDGALGFTPITPRIPAARR